MPLAGDDSERFLALMLRYARDAVAFQGLAPAMQLWFDGDAAVAYFDTGAAWVAAGGPVCDATLRGEVAVRFALAAKASGRRAVFFAVEDLTGLDAFRTLHLGEQPSHTPSTWGLAKARSRTLKEQLRRARAKGVVAEVVSHVDLASGPLRARVDDVVRRWVATRRIEPMAFLVSPDPHSFGARHAYVVARVGDDVVGLLSAVPAYAGHGWLVEHLVAAPGAPNGTAETLLAALHDHLAREGKGDDCVSLGLAPLSGDSSVWQRAMRTLARPLFDFEGLRRFKARLRPSTWTAVWLVSPRASFVPVAVADALDAFAGGSIVRFAVRSLLLRPRGLLWLLAIGLVPWTLLLVVLDVTHEEGAAGYSARALAVWIVFDVVLAVGLFRAAFRPAYRALAILVSAAFADAVFSWVHLHAVGFGPTFADSALRFAAAFAPCVGTSTLVFVTVQRARELARARVPPSRSRDSS